MSGQFEFSPRQRAEVIKEFRSEKGIVSLARIVQDYRDARRQRVPPATIRDALEDTLVQARKLRRAVSRLARTATADAAWIIDPLDTCISYADALLKYRYPARLRPGRLPHVPEIQLVQATAALWAAVHHVQPGRGHGPFSRLIAKLLRYSGVPGARSKYVEELVAEALPARLRVDMAGPDYPFTPLGEEDSLTPLQQAAEDLFRRVDHVARGNPKLTVFMPCATGEKPDEL